MKKIIALLLALVLLTQYLPMTARAEEGGYPHAVEDPETGIITIDGTLDGKTEADYGDIMELTKFIEDAVEEGKTSFVVTGENQAIIVEDYYIERRYPVAGYAFNEMQAEYNGTIDVTYRDVTKIIYEEFSSCDSLRTLKLPNVTTCEEYAFYVCSYLKKLEFGSVVTSVGEYAFKDVGLKGCELVLNCGQMQSESYMPNLDTNEWCGNEWKSITLTHTPETDDGDCLTEQKCTVCGEIAVEAKDSHTFDESGKCGCGADCPHESYTDGSCAACGKVAAYTVSLYADGTGFTFGAQIVSVNGVAVTPGETITVEHGKDLTVVLKNALSTLVEKVQVRNVSIGHDSTNEVAYTIADPDDDGESAEDFNWYDSETRTLTIPGEYITGNVRIGAKAYVRNFVDLNGASLVIPEEMLEQMNEEEVIAMLEDSFGYDPQSNSLTVDEVYDAENKGAGTGAFGSIVGGLFGKEGYNFAGFTDSEGNTHPANYEIYVFVKDVVLTAQWECAGHDGGTQTCMGYKCDNCGNWYGETNDIHDWSGKDGICANGCGKVCAHESYTEGVCDVCGYACPHTPNPDDGDCTTPVTCQHCGYILTEGRSDHVIHKGYTLSLKDSINVNVYLDICDEVLADESAYMTLTHGGKTQRFDEFGEKLENGYRFTTAIAAKEMMDEIKWEFHYGEGQVLSGTYSVRQYCEDILADESQKTEMHDLAKATLNYGAYAQLQFGYNTENLANAGLDAVDMSDVTLAEPQFNNGAINGAEFAGASLLLKSETILRLFFEVEDINNFTVTYGGQGLEPKKRDGLYYVDITGISAQRLDETVTVTVNGTDIQYSVMGYCYNVLMDEGADENLKKVVKALILYNRAADAYFAAANQTK